jgi:hypothetical protein
VLAGVPKALDAAGGQDRNSGRNENGPLVMKDANVRHVHETPDKSQYWTDIV